jgi:hypothetical protein
MKLGLGHEVTLFRVDAAGSGQVQDTIDLSSDALLLSLHVTSLDGSLNLVAYTKDDGGGRYPIITFPTITGPTTEILLRKSALSLASIEVFAIHSGSAKFVVHARGVPSGAASVKIEGSSSFTVTQHTVGDVAEALVSSGLTDRSGLMILNLSPTTTLWVGDTEEKASPLLGLPIYARGGSISLDLSAGSTLWAASETGTVDVRLVEMGA